MRNKIFICLILTIILTACSKPVEVRIQEQLDLGNKYLVEENYEQAVIAFNKVIEIDDKVIEAYAGLGAAYYGQKEYSSAISAYEKVVELDPKNQSAYSGIIRCYTEQGNEKQAGEILQRAIELCGEDGFEDEIKNRNERFEYYCMEAEKAVEEGEQKYALECYENALDIIYEEELVEKVEELRWEMFNSMAEAAYDSEGEHSSSLSWESDFSGDGLDDYFVAFGNRNSESNMQTWTVLYIDANAEEAEKVYEYSLEKPGPGILFGQESWAFEKEGIKYWVVIHYIGENRSVIRYCVFKAVGEGAELVGEGQEGVLEELKKGNVEIR